MCFFLLLSKQRERRWTFAYLCFLVLWFTLKWVLVSNNLFKTIRRFPKCRKSFKGSSEEDFLAIFVKHRAEWEYLHQWCVGRKFLRMPKLLQHLRLRLTKKLIKISRTESFMSGVHDNRGNEKKTPLSNIEQLKNVNTTKKQAK